MGKKTEFLYLNEADMLKAGVLDSKHCVDVLDEMFKLVGQGDYIMGGPNHNEHGIMLTFPDHPAFPGMPANGPDRRFMAMVAYLGGRFRVSGEKWYGSNIVNPSRGLPRSVLMVMLNDPDTCEPIALMSGNLISAVRTGAVPGVGVRYLARKDSEVCSVIGAGPVNKACFQAIISEAANLRQVRIFDVIGETAKKFANWAEETYSVEAVVCSSTEDAIRSGDIISVAASRLKPVEIKDEWIAKGSTIILTGNSQIEESYWKTAHLLFDCPMMHKAYMEDAHRSAAGVEATYKNMMGGVIYRLIDQGKLPPMEEAIGLGDIACGKVAGRSNDDERWVLQTSGMPVEDIAWGYELYTKAREMGLGQMLTVWDEPHWS